MCWELLCQLLLFAINITPCSAENQKNNNHDSRTLPIYEINKNGIFSLSYTASIMTYNNQQHRKYNFRPVHFSSTLPHTHVVFPHTNVVLDSLSSAASSPQLSSSFGAKRRLLHLTDHLLISLQEHQYPQANNSNSTFMSNATIPPTTTPLGCSCRLRLIETKTAPFKVSTIHEDFAEENYFSSTSSLIDSIKLQRQSAKQLATASPQSADYSSLVPSLPLWDIATGLPICAA